ncbi:MAG: methyltransferase domain-containing protein [Terracidiphilus sp.]|jgi:2-polyprenyl-3-methyl-5-hydroxy-6-metoxy-1,4-benzoquinol methylase
MQDEHRDPQASQPWDTLAQVYATSRHVSTDQLVEWPAQLKMCGSIIGKRVLDVGCGTGDKARYFAGQGAESVLGIDPCNGFAQNWGTHAGCSNLSFAIGRFEDLAELPVVASRQFDLIVCFQALMYAADLNQTLRTLRGLLSSGGDLVISIPHPFRFAILRHEIEGWGHGFAYQQTAPYRYPSPWKEDVLLEHAMPRFSDYVNAIAGAGLRIEASDEPAVTDKLRQKAPEKAVWMDRYVGILILRAHRDE